jgi:hypothetical protein
MGLIALKGADIDGQRMLSRIGRGDVAPSWSSSTQAPKIQKPSSL